MSVMKTIPMDTDIYTIAHPFYRNHERARNWLAVVTGPNAANCQRRFLDHLGSVYDVTSVRRNDVIEIAADYVTSRHQFYINREHWRIVGIVEGGLQVEVFPSLAKAMRAAREIAEGKPRSDQPQTPAAAVREDHLTRNVHDDELSAVEEIEPFA